MTTRIPNKINLPFGYVVKIKQATPEELMDVTKATDAWAAWDVNTRTIYLDKTLPLKKRRYLLTHELMHAVTDWQGTVLDTPHARVK